ncbi:MAG: N-6 DNA methylase [Alphaproteobacteria bacterium]|nr:N-6 DNA methylase [Alphaproteobacteria bacterium]
MSDRNIFDRYLIDLRRTAVDDKTEHTDRAALQTFLRAIAETCNTSIAVDHEPKRVADKGAPDFKIAKAGLILGYVENKRIGENLDRVLKSPQIARYKTLSGNLVLTDYLHFIWINKDGIRRETLCHQTDLENRRFRLRDDRIEAVAQLLRGFFSTAPEGIGRAQQLALALAARSRLLRDYLGEELVRQEREHKEGRLYGLFQIFRDQIFHELTLKEFADAFAQMLAYGLFLARLNSKSHAISLHNAREYVPGSFRLIRELVDFLAELEKDEYREIRWVVEEVLSIVNGLNLPAIHEDLSFRQRKAISRKIRAADEEEHRLFERDPFIYFYEDYLKAYDPAMRKGRGVYYTPPPIVNFIVRAIDDILKDTFGIRDGLADHRRVTVLDFACGTGTFLLEICQRIFENIGGPESGRADLIVREHILKNLFGFEFLIAPYTIAHLKLSQYLQDQQHPVRDNERLQVFLTNTLEPIEPQPNFLLPAISAEVESAQQVKDREILVIVGNPPYSGHSKNKGAWITNVIGGYKFTVESDDAGREVRVPLGERNPKWLNDDYVKFIRFAQLKMDAVEEGVVGLITNHSWLDNPTFRGMRQSLMRSFQQIHVLDLHGNAKKKERAPDGSKDENVFDIEQGVAISLFSKKPGLERGVWRGDLWGGRLDKYKAVVDESPESAHFECIEPTSPYYLYCSQNTSLQAEYYRGMPVPNILSANSVGIVTSRDRLAIHFTRQGLLSTVRDFAARDTEDARRTYSLGRDAQDWKVAWAQEDVRASGASDRCAVPILYRPFDIRWTYYTGRSNGFLVRPRTATMRNMLEGHNLGLITTRVTKDKDTVFCSSHVAAHKSASAYDISYLFPLYLDDNGRENISESVRAFLESRYEHHYTSEEIFGYLYGVLHAATYRIRYAEFLRGDFPRTPSPSQPMTSRRCRGWAGPWCRRICSVNCRAVASPCITGEATTPSKRCVMFRRSRQLRSTRRNPSGRCRLPFGSSASAAIRCSTNI